MSAKRTTWRRLIHSYYGHVDRAFTHVFPRESILDVDFGDYYGAGDGPEFIAWSLDFVYFGVEYDGVKSIMRVARNPLLEAERTNQ